MAKKPRLNFLQIWNMSFGFFGIQIGFALQNANTSRIFETLGAPTEDLAVYWLAAPVTGLIVQPIIGYYSDRTWHPRWGRRRPYFAIGAILTTLALLLMPNSSTLWMAVGALWIMDASINISMEPFRAFVGDLLPDSQRTLGFAMQSFFIGLGAYLASYAPWFFAEVMGFPNTAPEGEIPLTVKLSFIVGAVLYLFAVLWTVFSTKEYPPEEDHKEDLAMEDSEKPMYKSRFLTVGIILSVLGIVFNALVFFLGWEAELYILGGGFLFFGIVHLLAMLTISGRPAKSALIHIVKDLNTMPSTMVQLALVQFFSWFALFSMWIYANSAITSHVFGTTDTTSEAYNTGANLVSQLFGFYNLVAAIVAFLLPLLAKVVGRKVTHLIALFAGGIGLASIFFISDPVFLWISMIGVGIAWSSILSIPYAILSSALPADKMGYYMGVFNFFIVIPQILAASLLGFMLTTVFNGETIFILVVGGGSMILSGLLTLLVNDKKPTDEEYNAVSDPKVLDTPDMTS